MAHTSNLTRSDAAPHPCGASGLQCIIGANSTALIDETLPARCIRRRPPKGGCAGWIGNRDGVRPPQGLPAG